MAPRRDRYVAAWLTANGVPGGGAGWVGGAEDRRLRAGAGILSSMSSGSPSEEEEKPPISKEDSSFLDLDAHDSGDDVGDTELRHLEISLF